MLVLTASAASLANLDDVFLPGLDHSAIQYHTRPTNDPVVQLNRSIQDGNVQLKFDEGQGYLRSILDALKVPVESQIVPFSKTSVQSYRISPKNPRTLFFNDSVTVGWVRGGFIEVAAESPEQGVFFYILPQKPAEKPQFTRADNNCLSCHESLNTVGVPGMLVRSIITAPDGKTLPWLGNNVIDDRSPMDQRWAGWYVTGNSGAIRHLGNAMEADATSPDTIAAIHPLNLQTLKEQFDTGAYLSPYSDIVALMVFDHQMHMTNLITRMGWDTRIALFEAQQNKRPDSDSAPPRPDLAPILSGRAKELVDYMLFVDEAPLGDQIRGTSGFSETFSAQGPFDSQGRSLRQFDLRRRLMRYPCSYMIYSPAFDALPREAKDAIYDRMWKVLTGKAKEPKYSRLSRADRKSIIEILVATKKDLPDYFKGPHR